MPTGPRSGMAGCGGSLLGCGVTVVMPVLADCRGTSITGIGAFGISIRWTIFGSGGGGFFGGSCLNALMTRSGGTTIWITEAVRPLANSQNIPAGKVSDRLIQGRRWEKD